MNFETLKGQELPQLKELAGKMGLNVHHRAGKERVIKQIMESALLPQVNPKDQFKGEDMRPKALKHKEPEYNYTEADVREACKDFIAKDGMEAIFPGDDTVIFRCKGAEDSLNLKQPMRNIIRRGQIVSRGRLQLMGLNKHFDSMGVGGKNAYTDTVLS